MAGNTNVLDRLRSIILNINVHAAYRYKIQLEFNFLTNHFREWFFFLHKNICSKRTIIAWSIV